MPHKQNKILEYLKSQPVPDGKSHTHTRIGCKQQKISGGSYYVNDDDIKTFWSKYYTTVFMDGNPEYLTEKQLVDNGPILIDLDLRFETSIKSRQHSEQHIIDIIHKYIEECDNVMKIDTKTEISVFVMQKENVNCLDDKTKDGIHIIIGIKTHKAIQVCIREKMIKNIASLWDDLPITNSWEEVLDEGVTKGHVNWQVYGSKKPLHKPYQLCKIYQWTKHDNGLWNIEEDNLEKFKKNLKKNIEKLSARYTEWPKFDVKKEHEELIKKFNDILNKKNTAKLLVKKKAEKLPLYGYYNLLKINKAPPINEKDLDIMFDEFFEDILENKDIISYKIKEIYSYVMCLPDTYYGPGSFYNWIRVGWALKNADDKHFMTWLKFSSRKVCRSSLKLGNEFDWTRINELYQMWESFDMDQGSGLTERSIMYWVKKEVPSEYDKIHKDTVHYYIERTLDYQGYGDESNKGSPIEFDIARVLYYIFKDQFICVSVKSNLWYEFRNNRWHEIDSGTTLRELMSTHCYQYYVNITMKYQRMLAEHPQSSDEHKKIRFHLQKLTTVAQCLKRTNWKNNIMKEAKEAFYDPLFFEKLDQNPNLLCFNNYVIDFSEEKPENIYRKGRPDDYISKCTNIDYVPQQNIDNNISKEIHEFMSQLFPDERLKQYVWEHLASCLIGKQDNQTFNSYKGSGRNGKI